ncbi:hypothetical protein KCP69_25405 [Salmonella enterica subsp. enterica]|nr:hypothetical protein KCP69_25405 [Salmonella enterica subsp. enterica]
MPLLRWRGVVLTRTCRWQTHPLLSSSRPSWAIWPASLFREEEECEWRE